MRQVRVARAVVIQHLVRTVGVEHAARLLRLYAMVKRPELLATSTQYIKAVTHYRAP